MSDNNKIPGWIDTSSGKPVAPGGLFVAFFLVSIAAALVWVIGRAL